ncbi:unnamed protein product [Lymnaea stagnalis]|uniref:Transmembrane protein 106A n=1 Tax=Lymnaea stagnalis TaxID=6523 RepID=A0AAV2I7U6_LYMST
MSLFQKLKNMAGLNKHQGENSRLLASNRNGTQQHGCGSFNGTTNPANSEGYEELFKDSVPCPSCRGLGRVPKELENQLVALIPMGDGRLKPRRTILYVVIAVTLCVVTGGMLIFFLMPRDITISSNRPFLQPKHIDINVTAKFANFTVTNLYNVSNNNFYPVKISGVSMKSLYGNAVIAQSSAYKTDPLEISARSENLLSVPMDFILSGEHGSLVSHCISNWSWIHNLPILFEVTANYTYMGHSEQATLTTFQTVSCHPEPGPPAPTLQPPTTTSTTPAPLTTTVPTTTPELTTSTTTTTTSTSTTSTYSTSVPKAT